MQHKADVQGRELKTWSVGGAATQRSRCGSIWRESTSVGQGLERRQGGRREEQNLDTDSKGAHKDSGHLLLGVAFPSLDRRLPVCKVGMGGGPNGF